VWTSLRIAGGITDTLRFTHESTAPDRSYLEWVQEALAQRFEGVTVLTLDGSGMIENVAIHHRPLGGVLAISAEMGQRLGNSVGPGVFYQPPERPDGQEGRPRGRWIVLAMSIASEAQPRRRLTYAEAIDTLASGAP
jgi:hypothetical protein